MGDSVSVPLIESLCRQLAAWLGDTATPPTNPHWPLETWAVLEKIWRVHGVGPLLAQRLQDASWVPPDTQRRLQTHLTHNRKRIARMQEELVEILAAAERAGIRVMPLKGSILCACDYPLGLRPMADLDLLVSATDFAAMRVCLCELGYVPAVKHWKHLAFHRSGNDWVVDSRVEHVDNPRPVELHAHCRESFGGPGPDLTAAMWQSAQQATLLGQPAWLPDRDWLAVHLLVHASYHFWQGRGRLIQLLDLLRIWPTLTNPVAALAGVDAHYTLPALQLLRCYFPHLISATFVDPFRQQTSAAFNRWAMTLSLSRNSYLSAKPPGLYFGKAWRIADGRPDAIWQVLRFSFLPHPDELMLDHPQLAQSRWPWLAYALLPLDWVKRLRRR